MTRRSTQSTRPNAVERSALFRRARTCLRPAGNWFDPPREAEGGCGVTGFACTVPVRGRHIYEPSKQMRNRGNGKGGGVAACGFVPGDLGVSREVLEQDYILQVALLEPDVRADVEKEFVEPWFDVHSGGLIPTVDDFRDIPLLDVKPPDVARYFVRVKPDAVQKFADERGLTALTEREIEDEFVFQNSQALNRRFYASLGTKQAFVLSHARNLLILKIVGFAEAAVQYYCMENFRAHVWIAHQRYPTKGRVWHPGGAHPFIGMNEALVHNGDFANYHSVSQYLAQRNLFPQFLTDTEVSVLLFDLLHRTYGYPIEYVIEALAPTTELDFDRLPPEKQQIYRQIQAIHAPSSPDGPWFFIVARSLTASGSFQLLGITDTAMLRPQVFAMQEGEVSIALVCSEKQAIDATLTSLAEEDSRFMPVADRYWNARGGSHSDGGAFLMTVAPGNCAPDAYTLTVADKFGRQVGTTSGQSHCDLSRSFMPPADAEDLGRFIENAVENASAECLFDWFHTETATTEYDRLRWFAGQIAERTAERAPALGIEALTLALDRRYPTGDKKRSSLVTVLRAALEKLFEAQPLPTEGGVSSGTHRRITWDSRHDLRPPAARETTLIIDAREFTPEGADCDAALAVAAWKLGWKHIIHCNTRGTRFHAAGFGPGTHGLRIDCYDNPGDYLGSGIDGMEAYVHGNAQDQLCQIAKQGRVVVYGDVGQTFLYGAKGGEFFIMGNAAGRPLINAVGKPRAIINGTALDFLAESFMAGDPLDGGGFAIVNGLRFDDGGRLVPLDLPYPGSNLLSLASGGAIYIRDPHATLVEQQLNGGMFAALSDADWDLIRPMLEENQRLFGIDIERDLLAVDGVLRQPREVYRKVKPRTFLDEDEQEE